MCVCVLTLEGVKSVGSGAGQSDQSRTDAVMDDSRPDRKLILTALKLQWHSHESVPDMQRRTSLTNAIRR